MDMLSFNALLRATLYVEQSESARMANIMRAAQHADDKQFPRFLDGLTGNVYDDEVKSNDFGKLIAAFGGGF